MKSPAITKILKSAQFSHIQPETFRRVAFLADLGIDWSAWGKGMDRVWGWSVR